ncbi:MAG: hypothetical protein ACKO4Q_02275 [Planctomycetota bacterium]
MPSLEAAQDVLSGSVREALHRIGRGPVAARFGTEVTELCLRALQADPELVTAALEQPLPDLPGWDGVMPPSTDART